MSCTTAFEAYEGSATRFYWNDGAALPIFCLNVATGNHLYLP